MRTRILLVASCVAAVSAAWGVRADEVATTQPALVTLHLDSMPPADAVAEFTKQTGVPVQFWPQNLFEQNFGPNNGPPANISMTVDQQPLWVALDAICAESHLQPINTGQGENITLQFPGVPYTPLSKRPQSVNPNSTIVVESIQRSNSVSFQSGTPMESHSCGISLSAYIDPRVHPLSHHGATVETAIDESGKSIAVQQNQQGVNYGPSVMWKIDNIFVPLDYDPQVSHKLADFKGSIQISAVTASDKLEINNLQNAQDIEQTVGGMGVSVHDIKFEGNTVSAKITLRQGDMDKESWSQIPQTIFHDVKFLTADGKTLSTGGGGGGGGNKLEYTMNGTGSSEGEKPVKMVFEVPTKIEQMDLPFEFRDLQLP